MSKKGLKLIAFLFMGFIVGLGASFADNEVVVEDINFKAVPGNNGIREEKIKITNNTDKIINISEAYVYPYELMENIDCRISNGGLMNPGEIREFNKVSSSPYSKIGTYDGKIVVGYSFQGENIEYFTTGSITLEIVPLLHEKNISTYIDTDGNEFNMGSITLSDGTDSITILDSNLGAAKSGTGADAYGYYFQWGNNYGFGGGENGSTGFSDNRGTLSKKRGEVDASNFGWNNPYFSSVFIYPKPFDFPNEEECAQIACLACYGNCPPCDMYCAWEFSENRDKSNNNLLWGGNTDDVEDYQRQGPCPEGYHIPTDIELQNLISIYSIMKGDNFINNIFDDLLLPKPGYRNRDGKMKNVGNDIRLSTSNGVELNDHYFVNVFNITDMAVNNLTGYRSQGYSVRCFKDSSEYITLKYDTRLGTPIQSQAITEDNNGYIPYNTTRDGVEFDGWYDSFANKLEFTAGTNTFSNFVVKDDDYDGVETIYAKWNDERMVVFDADPFQIVPPQVVKIGEKIVEPKPEFGGEILLGWTTDEAGENYFDFNTSVSENGDAITLYAQWIDGFKISYELDGGINNSDNPTYYSDIDANIELKNPSKQGFNFDGWYLEPSFDSKVEKITNDLYGDLVLYAKWSPIEYAITYILNGGVNNADNPNTYNMYDSIVLKAPTRDGYIFNGWFTEDAFENTITEITIGGNKSINLYAKWTKISTPTPSYSGGGGSRRGSNVSKLEDNKKVDEEIVEKNEELEENNNKENNTDKSELELAYEFAYKNGITTMDSMEKAELDQPLTRIAMAKMLSQYAINVLGKVPANKIAPRFDDVTDELNEEYYGGSEIAYQLGIMGLNMPDNKFRPFDLVTRAEFGTVLSRLLFGLSDGDELYYETHLSKLKDEGIITNDTPELEEARGYIMLMLMRAANK